MSNLIEFQKNNPTYKIIPVSDPSFAQYGAVYSSYDLDSIGKIMETIPNPSGTKYIENIPELTKDQTIQSIARDLFAGMPVSVGATIGHSIEFTAFEYHQSSEVNIMMDDVIMVLAKRQILEQFGTIDPNTEAKMFYVPKNTVIELYNDTLHYTPLEVYKTGYKVIVMVVSGTNDKLPEGFHTSNPRVVKKGKFQVVHPTRQDKIDLGYQVALEGNVIKVNPV